MRYEMLDMTRYARKAHFDYFCSMANPYVGVTEEVDVTKLYRTAKDNGLPLFLSTLFAVTHAANAVPELRQRIRSGDILQYEWCRPSYTVALADETYCYCTVNKRTDSLPEFVAEGKREQAAAMEAKSVADGEDDGDLLFVSCLPWMRYAALTQPTPSPADSNPRLTWGKMTEESNRVYMPLTLLAHHAIVDGLHIARFYEAFERCVQTHF